MKNYEEFTSSERIDLQLDRKWKSIFDKYDRNKTGEIKLSDLKKVKGIRRQRSVLRDEEQEEEDIPEDVVEQLKNNATYFHDETVNYDQFLEMVYNSELGRSTPTLYRLIRYATQAVVPKSARQPAIRRYLEEYNCLPPPIFILSMSLVQIVFFIYYCATLGEVSTIGPVPYQSLWIFNPCKRQEAWRFYTYTFIHAGLFHIFFNILIQIILGLPLEMVHKWWRVGVVYSAGVVAGSLASTLTDPDTFLAGASGGVYSLLAAHLASVVINWNELEYSWLRLGAILVYTITDFGIAIYGRYASAEQTSVSYSAHIAGAAVGFLIGINVLHNFVMQQWEVMLAWAMLAVCGIFVACAVLFNVLNEDHFLQDNDPLCWRFGH